MPPLWFGGVPTFVLRRPPNFANQRPPFRPPLPPRSRLPCLFLSSFPFAGPRVTRTNRHFPSFPFRLVLLTAPHTVQSSASLPMLEGVDFRDYFPPRQGSRSLSVLPQSRYFNPPNYVTVWAHVRKAVGPSAFHVFFLLSRGHVLV